MRLLAWSNSSLETDIINAMKGSWCRSSLEEHCHICDTFCLFRQICRLHGEAEEQMKQEGKRG